MGISEGGCLSLCCPGSTPSLQDQGRPFGDDGWMEIWHTNGCNVDIQHVPQPAYPVSCVKSETDRFQQDVTL